MARLSRAELQGVNRAKVLAAADAEFAERGFRDAKVDAIAERAELTRGAVYSNFPGKRALYFAVLAERAERAPAPPPPAPGRTAREALGAFARAWVSRLPLAGADGRPGEARMDEDLIPEVQADEPARRAFAQLMKVDALLLGLALERLGPEPAARGVRTAEAALTLLHGAGRTAAAAPGFTDPFDVVRACEHLDGVYPDDAWPEPAYPPPVRETDEPWSPPEAADLVAAAPADLAADGVLCVLGVHRLGAVEEAVRAARPGDRVTAAVTAAAPGELLPLARLAVADLTGCLRGAFPAEALPRLQVVCDPEGAIAAAAGAADPGDGTETAVRIADGRITARAEGRLACHAAAAVRPGAGEGAAE
ncbi:TetR/AcrR family transcriptional regulator [Nocardiopsis sp. CNT-189]|uniref:TetR/AcrR family transcriptional regulator n=1 Tax=Nocardiopsis oceanisediminis TaxID=2816862 RepID=UPI003B2E600E